MTVHVLERSQVIAAPLESCWAFFSNPRNLPIITPPELDFDVLSILPPQIHPGLMIRYRLRPLFNVPVTWVTEITHVEEPAYFVDEQRIGPYRMWHHEHRFIARDAHHTEIHDLVHYSLPLWPFGELARRLVHRQLETIFDFRKSVLSELFPETDPIQANRINH